MSLLLTDRRSPKDPGYFRIGLVSLTIPPEEISTAKITNNQELNPLRTRFPLYAKSGQSRWDVTVNWKALVQYGAGNAPPDYSEYEKLQRIVAQFVAAPFVEVESAHLRNLIGKEDPDYMDGDRMAFALRQLRIDTLADVVDGLEVSLTMSLFNYRPFTPTFGYKGANSQQPVSADQSPEYREYIERWINNNIEHSKFKVQYESLPDWRKLDPGTTVFNWRLYKALPKDPKQPQVLQTLANSTPTNSTTKAASKPSKSAPTRNLPPGKLSGRTPAGMRDPADPVIKQVIVEAAQRVGLDPDIALTLSQIESGFRAEVVNPKSFATGLFQLLPSTAKRTVEELKDPTTNANAGCAFLQRLLSKYNGDITKALICYGPGEKYGIQNNWDLEKILQIAVVDHKTGKTIQFRDFALWFDNFNHIYQQRKALSGGAASAVVPVVTADATPPPITVIETKQTPQAVAHSAAVNDFLTKGWVLDHETDLNSFVYLPQTMTIGDSEHSGEQNSFGTRLYTAQMSILMVNNLPAVPLEAYQYPIYQHIGAAATQIQISLLSDGDMSNGEPEHPGLNRLSGALTTLENQYHRMKVQWRAVTSIHGMQSVFLSNQLLNMLGIFAVMPQSLNTTTIPDAPGLVQASLLCSQYENVFEQLTPYQVRGAAAYDQIWQNLVFSNSDRFQQAVQKNQLLQPLADVVKARKARDLDLLFQYLMKNSDYLAVPTNVALSDHDKTYLKGKIQMAYLYYRNARVAARVNKDGQLNFTDFVALAYQPNPAPDMVNFRNAYMAEVNALIANGNGRGPDPVEALYKQYVTWLVQNDVGTSSAVQQIEVSPDFHEELAKLSPQLNGPGADDANLGHVAYRDLGLSDLNDGPGRYFIDYGAAWRSQQKKYAEVALANSLDTYDQFNSTLKLRTADLRSSDSRLQPEADTASRQSSMKAILDGMILPSGSMSRAFPAFKLFLVEDDNLGTFYMYDDFYSYASVLGMEIIRYQNKPDTAVIQISNMANLLSHKLFDSSVEGKFEWNNTWTFKRPGQSAKQGVTSAAGGVVGPVSDAYSVERTRGAVNYLTSGFDESGLRMPLQYFALQTGSKIQVRLGFANNPDELEPVFNGIVTQIEEGPVLTITAQGFGIELSTPAPEELDSNGFNIAWLGAVPGRVESAIVTAFAGGNSVKTNLLNSASLLVHSFDRGPAMGGFAIMGEGGEATSVMAKMLTTSMARHFGHWQVNVPVEKSLKGYGYAQLIGQNIDPSSRISSLLVSSYDRSKENVLINHSYLPGGNAVTDWANSGFNIETLNHGAPAAYYIPKDPAITPWRIIQDVKRRYPEFLVAIKPYGFPVGCDATLVFGHPNSFYLSRLPLAGEESADTMTVKDDGNFKKWWFAGGRDRLEKLFNDTYDAESTPLGFSFVDVTSGPVMNGMNDGSLLGRIDNAGDKAPETFVSVVNQVIDILQVMQGRAAIGGRFLNGTAGAQLQDELQNFRNLKLEAKMTVQRMQNAQDGTSNTPLPGNRIKPVRKWILVTSDNIVKNAITLNQNFYNAVRVTDYTVAANQGIRDIQAHMRILDVDRLIIDPDHNVKELPGMYKRYAAGFLREEVGKMYRGELHLTGIPEIEPYDVLMLFDRSTGMIGPVEVESVIHSFDQQTGLISIVKPRALMSINEAMTAGILDGIFQFCKALPQQASGLWDFFSNNPGASILAGIATIGTGVTADYGVSMLGKVTPSLLSRIASKFGLGGAAEAGEVAGTTAAEAAGTAAAEGAGTQLALDFGVAEGAGAQLALDFGAVEVAAEGTAVVAAEAVAGTAAATAAGGAAVTVGVAALPVLIVTSLLAAGALCVLSSNQQELNPLLLMPLNRFGYPWVAGIDGWKTLDMSSSFAEKWEVFKTYDIEPYLQAIKDVFSQPGPNQNSATIPWQDRFVGLLGNN